MLIDAYDLEVSSPPCDPGAERWSAFAHLPRDISEALPYLNAVWPGAIYDHEAHILTLVRGGRRYTLRPLEIAVSNLEDRDHARQVVDRLVGEINGVWERRATIAPSTARRQRPTVMQVYKLLPWYYVIAIVCIGIGLQMLGLIQVPIPTVFARQRDSVRSRGLVGALLLGLVSGLVSSQCATPVLLAVLSYVMAKGAPVYGATLLFVYALGRGVPIIAAGTFAGLARNLSAMGRWTSLLEKASGALVVAVGLYFLWIA